MKVFLFALALLAGCGPSGFVQAHNGIPSASYSASHRVARQTDCVDQSMFIPESDLWDYQNQNRRVGIAAPPTRSFIALDVTNEIASPLLVGWNGDASKQKFIDPYSEASWNIAPSSSVWIQQTYDNWVYGSGVQFDGIACTGQ